ncbi:hypothetical protein KJ836_03530, partial [Patescibacteria group bacterium]|nr:hypothetical protein [Patescibacteria group bacterium]
REVYRLLLDISNEIEPSWVNVTIPNGGEDFEPEFYQSILWTSEHYNGTVRIEYSNENGLHQIVDSTNNDGEFEWLVPVDISDNVLILITLLENENINDMSDDYFSISEAGWFIDISDPYPDIADCALNNFEEPILIAHNWTFFEDLIFFKEYSVKGQEKFSWNVVEDSSWDPLTPFSLSLSAGEGSGFFYVAYQGIDQIGCTLSKYTVTGQLLWSKTWGELMGPVNVMYAGNNVCLVGSWRGEVDFDPDVDSVDYRSSVDNSIDSCLIFISSNGDYIDTKTWGGESSDYALSLISMADGVIYVAGEFSSLNADFDPGINEDIRSTNGLSDVYLIQFEDQGSFSWVNTWGSAFSDKLTDLIYATEVGVVCTGAVADIADFDPGPDTDNKGQINSSSSFVSVFDENGVYSWSHVWFIDLALCVENYEQWIYLSGEYFAGIDFDPTGGVDVPSGDGGSFLTRLNSQGNYDWTCVYDSPTTIDLESDTGGHMYMLSLSSLGKVSSDGSW